MPSLEGVVVVTLFLALTAVAHALYIYYSALLFPSGMGLEPGNAMQETYLLVDLTNETEPCAVRMLLSCGRGGRRLCKGRVDGTRLEGAEYTSRRMLQCAFLICSW